MNHSIMYTIFVGTLLNFVGSTLGLFLWLVMHYAIRAIRGEA